ncbi:MAG: hypothetical protein WBY88_11325 [Desulfosarcina sp.]
MDTPFPFDGMLAFAFLSALLLLGIALRANIGCFQRYLVPGCLIGGLLGLGLMHSKMVGLDASTLETIAYHFFNISFISMGLTTDGQANPRHDKGYTFKGPAWMALMQGLTFPLQAVVGGFIVLLLGWFGLTLFPTFGFLVPLAFNEGPGQALSLGKAWESVGFANGATIGLSFATIGYVLAFFVGVPLVNRGIRNGRATFGPRQLPLAVLRGLVQPGDVRESAGNLTIHSGNAETMAFQAALVGCVYGITYFLIVLIGTLVPPDVLKILWGFFFILGLIVALMVKWIMSRTGVHYLADAGVQRRITGWSVDYMVVATVAAIQLKIVWEYILPIGLMGTVAGVLTTALVVYLGRRLPAHRLERTAAIYGTVTGTVVCGLLLLRILDPEFKTPVAYELAVMNVFVVPIVGLCTVLTNGPLWWGWPLWLTVLVFVGVMAASLILMKLLGLLNSAPADGSTASSLR